MMEGGLMQGAAIGALFGIAFDKLFKLFLDATQLAARFRSDLDHLQTTIRSVKLAVDDAGNGNNILVRPPHEIEALTDGLIEAEKLIQKCSNVNYWNPISRWYYSKKLTDFEALLANTFQIYVAAFNFRQNTSVSIEMNSLEEKLDQIATMLNNIEIGRSSSNGCSGMVVGFENSSEERNGMLLLEEDETVNVMELSEVVTC